MSQKKARLRRQEKRRCGIVDTITLNPSTGPNRAERRSRMHNINKNYFTKKYKDSKTKHYAFSQLFIDIQNIIIRRARMRKMAKAK